MEERTEYTIQYDFHLTNVRQAYLVHHTLTPLALSRDGKLWLGLCTVAMSSRNVPGHIVMRREGSPEFYEYNLALHRWEVKRSIVLNDTERSVLCLSTQGYTMNDIAARLHKSVDTIKSCKRALFAKLGVRNIAEALYHAANYRLL